MEKRAIITGAGGFIGSHLATRLKKEGYWIRGVDLKYPEFSKTSCDEFIIGDLRDPKTVEIVIPENIDELFTFACDMGGAGYIFTGDNDANVMHNSAMINLNVANECVKKKVKKVFFSSSACIYPEHNQLEPNNPKCSEGSEYPANPDSCLSFDTSVMTKSGFKPIADIELTDEIATLSSKGYLEFHFPTDKQTLKYCGKMIQFKSKNYNCLVTPDHKLMTLMERGSDVFNRIKAKDFISIPKITKGYFKRNCMWSGDEKYNKFIEIPSIEFEKNNGKKDRGKRKKSGFKFEICDYLKFVGWFITEGHCGYYRKKDYEVQIRQCKKENLSSIISLCEKMGLKPHKSSYKNDRVVISSKALWNHFKNFGHGAKNKKLLSWILELPSDKLKILFDIMLLGDGSISKNKVSYGTSSPFLRDQFVEISLKLGYVCTIYTRPAIGNRNEGYDISIAKRSIHKVTNENISYVNYDGLVYDLTVPNHIFYIRRNGKHLWTGNSYGWEKIFSERLYMAYNRNYNLDVRICRFHNIFGPEGAWNNGKEKAPAAICRKVAEADNNSTIEIWGDGCLPAEEEIITENGLKKVCNINLFDKVLGKEGFQKVINTFKRNYKGKLYIINSKGLLPFKVTEEHPVKIMRLKKFCKAHSPHYCKPNCFCRKHTCSHDIVFKREWLKPSEINYKTDYLCVPKIKDIREIEIDLSKYVGGHHTGLPQEEPLLKKFVINEDWAWLLGLYVAEGWSTDKKVSWCLGRHEKKLRLCLHNKLDKLGIKWFESNKPSSPSSSETNIYRAPLAKWLKITFGDRATNKIIPKFIYELDKKEILYFIKGFCDGDGTHKSLYASKRFSISSSSKSLLVGLQILLSKVDNFGTILWKDNWYGKTSKSGKILSGGKVSYAENPMTVSWFQDENYIYVPVKSVEELDFDGFVYNFETEDNTYGLPACVHNCQTRSFLYIDECLEATLRFMRNDNNFLGPVNIGSEEMISINDFTKMIINISGKNLTIKNIPGPEGVRGRNSDNNLYKEKMNWVVSQPLKIGMEKLYKWVEEQVIINGLDRIANKHDYVTI